MKKILITGTGVYTPSNTISNEEIAESFNTYVAEFNQQHADEIATGKVQALSPSDPNFMMKAAGIRNRYVMNKTGILDPHIMKPLFPARDPDQMSVQCEMALAAAKQALQKANKKPSDIDAIIFASTNIQRPYPGISVELQQALGCKGFGFDMNMACSSATFGLQVGATAVAYGTAKCALVVSSELLTAQVNFRERESHFLFGDAAVAAVIETADTCQAPSAFEILSIKLQTEFSNNIRCDFGFLNRLENAEGTHKERFFAQEGRKVFREVVPMVVELITQHLAENKLTPKDIARFWLHQANSNMNRLIATKLLGREPEGLESPTILDEYANTAAAGALIVFNQYNQDLKSGDLGVLCSFGAGYSIGDLILRKIVF